MYHVFENTIVHFFFFFAKLFQVRFDTDDFERQSDSDGLINLQYSTENFE